MEAKDLNVENVVYLTDLNENPLRSLNINYEVELETIKDDIDSVRIVVPIEENVVPEQKILYKNKKYVITEVEERKVERKAVITSESLFTELNTNVESFNIESEFLEDALEILLDRLNWSVGVIEIDKEKYSLAEENQTALYIVRKLDSLSTDSKVQFDTIKREINFIQDSSQDLGTIFRYKKNIKEITKNSIAPKITRLKPIGNGGLTVESINGGSEYIEDFSWYMSMGMSEEEARERYTKTRVWEDDRYIYVGNLLKEGKKKLADLSHPRISYEVEVSYLGLQNIEVNDFAYVIDEELGIKVKVEVVKLNRFKDPSKDKVELNYLVPGLHNESSSGGGSGSGKGNEAKIVYERLIEDKVVGNEFNYILSTALSTFAPTNVQLFLFLSFKSSKESLIEGYLEQDGKEIGLPIKQQANSGWNTLSYSMTLTQIQEGARELNFWIKSSSSELMFNADESDLTIVGKNILGGKSTDSPNANVSEEVSLNIGNYKYLKPSEQNEIFFDNLKDILLTENITFNENMKIEVTENINVEIDPE